MQRASAVGAAPDLERPTALAQAGRDAAAGSADSAGGERSRRVGRPWPGGLLLLAVLCWTTVASAQPAGEQAAPTTAPDEAAQRAQEQAYLHLAEARLVVDMARELAPTPGELMSSGPVSPPWKAARRIALLEAALRIHEPLAQAYWELYLARRDVLAVLRAQAEQDATSATRARAGGQASLAEQFDRRAELGHRAADEQRAPMLEALGRYVQVRPGDLTAWQDLLNGKLALLQDVQARIDLLTAELPRSTTQPSDLPVERTSMVRTMLADLLVRQGQMDQARAELEQAIGQMPMNGRAKALLVQIKGAQATSADELDLLLTDFAINPTDVESAERVAEYLARCNVYGPLTRTVTLGEISETQDLGAVGFYQYSAKVRKAMFPDAPLPTELLLKLGEALIRAGRPAEATPLIRQAISQTEPGTLSVGQGNDLAPLPAISLESRVLLIEALAGHDAAAAREEAKAIEDYHRGHQGKAAFAQSAPLLTWLSWYYLRVPPLLAAATTQPAGGAEAAASVAMAVELARAAVKAGGDPKAPQAVLGAALASTARPQDAKEAIDLLTPLAVGNAPWQKLYLGLARRTAGAGVEGDALLKTPIN